MNSERKIALIITLFLILFIGGGYFAIKIFSEAFGTDCKKNKSWTFNEYKIIEYECLGWAGPKYYPLYLNKNGKELANSGSKIDSCRFRFRPDMNLYLTLNICTGAIIELRPQKNEIDLNKIDSIVMYKNSNPIKKKKLDENKIKQFVNDWNKSEVSDYREGNLNSIFSNYQYRIKVYKNDKVKEFVTYNHLIADETNWTYYITNYSNKNYMNQLWNE